ncbi:MAG: ABC transporter substrate-binding protein [Candidatus Hydrogenedentes bacterium]|nr:ABC transporter substrate-binding protein [Candidatus Hydrogenedentota bacterium]
MKNGSRVKGGFLSLVCCLASLAAWTGSRCAVGEEVSPVRVRLQLKWSHQFQFAGFYAAVEKGFYRESGLEVELEEGQSGTDFIERVVSGAADFGVELPDLLLRRNAGAPVVVLAAIYQHSPYVVASLEGTPIASPHDLVGRSVMLRPSSNAEILAMLLNEGVPLEQVRFVDHAFTAAALASGEVDAISMYSSTIMHEKALEGKHLNLLHPLNYGVDFYGDCLFTSERMLEEYPDRVRAFREASLRGWEYAMEHPREMAELIHNRYAPGKSVENLMAESQQMMPLLLHKFVEPGHMNPGRWRHIADTFAEVGLLPPNVSLEGFIYNPDAAPDTAWLRGVAVSSFAALVILALVAVVLLLFNRRLDGAVRVRTRELEQANRALESEMKGHAHAEAERLSLEHQVWHAQKLESLGVLAGGIAHDFNNLLTVILGSADMALQVLGDDAQARPLVSEIRDASNRAADLTRQMLAYSGRGHFEIREVNLNQLVGEIGRLLASSFPKNAQIDIDLAAELPLIRGDSAQIQQIVMNLITNAAESIPAEREGTVRLTTRLVACSKEDLRKSCLPESPPPGEYVCIEVVDTGNGMSPEAQERLFEPFSTTKASGRGLGMAATLGIVRGHRGAIMVESALGTGTTIRVLLPSAAKSANDLDPRPVSGADGWRGRGTVLLVDDEEAVRSLAARMLERIGFDVLVAGDGVEGVALFRERSEEIRCVLLDFSMPRMDGVQASLELQRVREDIPIIVCSGFNRHEMEERFAGRAIAAFLHKPFRYEQIRHAFQTALGED